MLFIGCFSSSLSLNVCLRLLRIIVICLFFVFNNRVVHFVVDNRFVLFSSFVNANDDENEMNFLFVCFARVCECVCGEKGANNHDATKKWSFVCIGEFCCLSLNF